MHTRRNQPIGRSGVGHAAGAATLGGWNRTYRPIRTPRFGGPLAGARLQLEHQEAALCHGGDGRNGGTDWKLWVVVTGPPRRPS